jgi:hypothetical protein
VDWRELCGFDAKGRLPEAKSAEGGARSKEAQGAGEAQAAEMKFKRELVMAFAKDGTTNDVLYNLTSVKELLEQVAVPVVQEYSEPWLPVVAQAGPLVSGEAIKNQEGEVVGGDVLKSEVGIDDGQRTEGGDSTQGGEPAQKPDDEDSEDSDPEKQAPE